MAKVELRNLRKEFGKLVAVNDISLTFAVSKVTCLLGPSGCGKTTLMRMVSGLETPTRGEILFDGEPVTELPPSERNIGMVFQYPVVYQGMSVRRNIELPLLSIRELSAAERSKRVHEAIEVLKLEDVADVDVSSLMHAVKQKVAVARTIARKPPVMLLDEPITNVDPVTKSQLKWLLKDITRDLQQTIIYVTHDQTEAMTLADEIMLMNEGRIVHRGSPREVYTAPQDRFGGWFLGNPGMNFVDHDVSREGNDTVLTGPLFPAALALDGLGDLRVVTVGIRPERVVVGRNATAGSVAAEVVHAAVVAGGQQLLILELGGGHRVRAKVPEGGSFVDGDQVHVCCPLEHISVFDGAGARVSVTLRRRSPAT